MNREEFEKVVAEELERLPETFRRGLENVAIVVEEMADDDTLRRAGVSEGAALLGFYHGVPLPRRARGYNMVLPDRISIYRLPIIWRYRDDQEIRRAVARVLRHEVAHYYGIEDDRLREIGAY